eukprot:6492161-Heterocapsa_arctica.AAC.2
MIVGTAASQSHRHEAPHFMRSSSWTLISMGGVGLFSLITVGFPETTWFFGGSSSGDIFPSKIWQYTVYV